MSRREKDLILSEKHGVNPSIPICYFCGKEKNMIYMLGKLKGDVEAPMHAVYDMEPCDQCKKWMEKGVMLIEVKNNCDHEDPYRTGVISVIKDEAINKMFPEDQAEELLKMRCGFVEKELWTKLGLPRENINNMESGESAG